MTTSLDPKFYVGKRQDGVWESDLKARLLNETEESRASFLCEILGLQEASRLSTRPWFQLATSVLADSESFERLLRRGLSVANASTIKSWLEACLPRLGVRRTIRILEEEDA